MTIQKFKKLLSSYTIFRDFLISENLDNKEKSFLTKSVLPPFLVCDLLKI